MRSPVRRVLALAVAALAGVGALALPAPAYADPGELDPYGALDTVARTGHTVRVHGVAHDPDAAAITVASPATPPS
jgi:hypothetical protein